MDWEHGILKDPAKFSELPERCLSGQKAAVVTNANQMELLESKYSDIAHDEMWLGIRLTSTGYVRIFLLQLMLC